MRFEAGWIVSVGLQRFRNGLSLLIFFNHEKRSGRQEVARKIYVKGIKSFKRNKHQWSTAEMMSCPRGLLSCVFHVFADVMVSNALGRIR